jgi:hypothetical protein
MIRGAALAAVLAAGACGRIGFGLTGDAATHPIGDGGAASDGRVPMPASCTVPPLPDTSAPDHVIGDGTPTDCTEASVRAAVLAGGVTVLNCGSGATIDLTSGELVVDGASNVISGYGVTLNAGGTGRVIHAVAGVQSLALLGLGITGGNTTASGAGVYIESGALSVFDATITRNNGPTFDPSAGGGGIAAAVGATVAVYRSTVGQNMSANGGAIDVFSDLTIIDSVISSNTATGAGGGSGSGGIGGGIAAVGIANDTFCGVSIDTNTAGDLGGGIARIATNNTGSDSWQQSSIVDNTGNAGAGGMYVQGIALALDRVAISENGGGGNTGGLWYIAPGPFTATQIQIANNTAASGLGAGLELSGASGRIAFSSIVGNQALCPACWAAWIDGGSGVTLTSSVFDSNTAGAPNNAITCAQALADGGGNFQWPVMRAGGGTDDPSALCATTANVIDPMIGGLLPRAGPAGTYLVTSPAPGSPVIGAASTCPAVDLLGNPRPVPCTAGAVEP